MVLRRYLYGRSAVVVVNRTILLKEVLVESEKGADKDNYLVHTFCILQESAVR